MWMLNLIPDELVYGVLIVSLLVVFFSSLLYRIPFISQYILVIRTIATIVAIAVSVLFGIKIDQKLWGKQVEEFKQRLAAAEEKSKETNVVIETKVVTKTNVIREKGQEVVQYIDREVVKVDNACTIAPAFVKAHNDAANLTK